METQVEPMKNAQFGFLNFLWLEMRAVREKQKEGDHLTALLWLMEFVDYLGDDFQNKLGFQEKVKEIRGKLEKMKPRGTTLEDAHVRFKRQLNEFARVEYRKLLIALSLAYDQKGYYEIRFSVPTRKGDLTEISRKLG